MKAEERVRGQVRILDLDGNLNLGEGDLVLREAVRGLLDAGHGKIVLNLQRVAYVDSSGLAELIACKKRILERGGDLKLLTPPKRVFEMLQMSRLTEIFDIFSNEPDAVGSF